MVLTVAELHEPAVAGGVEAVAGGAIEADALQGEGVDLAGTLPEVGFDPVPGFGVAQPSQEQGEAVISEVDLADGQPGDGLEAVVGFVGPGADMGLAVIGLGEDVSDPEGDEPTERKSLMVGMRLEVLIEELGEPELDQEAEDQGDVIDAFVNEAKWGRHGGAPTRVEEKRRCTAGGSPGEGPGKIHVNIHGLRGKDKDIIRGILYIRSAKEEF
jgi:hypothetical protein